MPNIGWHSAFAWPRARTLRPPNASFSRGFLAQSDLIRHGKVVRRGQRGPQKAPTKKLVSLRLSPEAIDHFRASGHGWQTRTDGILRQAIRKRARAGI